MFTLKNHGGAGTLTHLEELLAAACYHHGRWFGMGIEILEIRGDITEAMLRSLLANRHPITGRPLVVSCEKRRGKSLPRFTEVIVTLPWSVAALIGTNKDVVTSHGHAADAALMHLEMSAAGKPRADDYSLITLTGSLVAVSFDSLIVAAGVTVPQTRYMISASPVKDKMPVPHWLPEGRPIRRWTKCSR